MALPALPCRPGHHVVDGGRLYRCVEVVVPGGPSTEWRLSADWLAEQRRRRQPEPPPAVPKAPGEPSDQPPPDTGSPDPRTLPCTIGDQVAWDGKTWQCKGQRLRDGRSRTYWGLAPESIPGFNPETGRVVTDQGALIEALNKAIEIAVHSAFAVGLAPAVAVQLSRLLEGGGRLAQAVRQAERLAPLAARIEKEHQRIQGILDNTLIGTSIRSLRTVHRIARLSSSRYRAKIGELYEATGDLSRAVFGRAEVVSSALALVQMAAYDAAAIQGKSQAEAQTLYLDRAVSLGNLVERKSRDYARSPRSFWADVGSQYLDPLLETRLEAGQQAQRAVGALETGLTAAAGVADRVTDRLRDYERELAPIADAESVEELARIRRIFDAQIEAPLKEVSTWWRDVWPLQAETLAGQVILTGEHTERLDTLDELLPESVDQPTAVAVSRRRVWGDILEDTLEPRGQSPGEPGPVAGRLESAYSAILGD